MFGAGYWTCSNQLSFGLFSRAKKKKKIIELLNRIRFLYEISPYGSPRIGNVWLDYDLPKSNVQVWLFKTFDTALYSFFRFRFEASPRLRHWCGDALRPHTIIVDIIVPAMGTFALRNVYEIEIRYYPEAETVWTYYREGRALHSWQNGSDRLKNCWYWMEL